MPATKKPVLLAVAIAFWGCRARPNAREASLQHPGEPPALALQDALALSSSLDSMQQRVAVGFSMRILEDPSRNATDGLEPLAKRPRQLFVASWYPTSLPNDQLGAKRMRIGDFSRVSELIKAPSDLQKKYLRRVDESVARSIRLDVLQSAHLSPIEYRSLATREDKRIIGTLLNQKTRSIKDAPPSRSKACPVVVYHPGAGSAYFENYHLFEELALRGYCVFTSGFYMQDSYIPYVGTFEDSLSDLQLIFHTLSQNPALDSKRRTLIGYSFGAQVALSYATRDLALSAIVSLDSTYERLPLAKRSAYTRAQYLRASRVQAPILFLTQEEGTDLSWMKMFINSDRWNIGVRGADHDTFRALGNLDIAASNEKERHAQASHRSLVREVLNFVDATVGESGLYRFQAIPQFLEDRSFVPRTETGIPLSTKELRAFHRKGRLAELVKARCTPSSPSDGPSSCVGFAEYLLLEGESKLGASLLHATHTVFPHSWEVAKAQATYCLQRGDHECAAAKYRFAIQRIEQARPQLGERAADYYLTMIRSLLDRAASLSSLEIDPAP